MKCQGTGEIGSLYWGFVISRFLSIHYTITGLKNIVCYTQDFVIQRFVKSRLHCITDSSFVSIRSKFLFNSWLPSIIIIYNLNNYTRSHWQPCTLISFLSFWPAPWIESSGRVQKQEVRESRTSGFLRSLRIWNNNGYHRLQKWPAIARVHYPGPSQSSWFLVFLVLFSRLSRGTGQ